MCESSHEWKIMGKRSEKHSEIVKSFLCSAATHGFSSEPFHKSNTRNTSPARSTEHQICWKIYIIFLSTFMRGWVLKHVEGNDAWIKRPNVEVRILFWDFYWNMLLDVSLANFYFPTLLHFEDSAQNRFPWQRVTRDNFHSHAPPHRINFID